MLRRTLPASWRLPSGLGLTSFKQFGFSHRRKPRSEGPKQEVADTASPWYSSETSSRRTQPIASPPQASPVPSQNDSLPQHQQRAAPPQTAQQQQQQQQPQQQNLVYLPSSLQPQSGQIIAYSPVWDPVKNAYVYVQTPAAAYSSAPTPPYGVPVTGSPMTPPPPAAHHDGGSRPIHRLPPLRLLILDGLLFGSLMWVFFAFILPDVSDQMYLARGRETLAARIAFQRRMAQASRSGGARGPIDKRKEGPKPPLSALATPASPNASGAGAVSVAASITAHAPELETESAEPDGAVRYPSKSENSDNRSPVSDTDDSMAGDTGGSPNNGEVEDEMSKDKKQS